MSIMPCYPDERSVENELGGKWELLFAEEFDEPKAEGYEFPRDVDGSDLRLNGVLCIVTLPPLAHNTGYLSMYMEDTINSIGYASLTQNLEKEQKAYIKTIIHNNFMETFSYNSSSNAAQQSTYIKPYFSVFKESITEFSLAISQPMPVGTKVEIYVLRGV